MNFISGIEEGILIEANDFNVPVLMVYNDVLVQNMEMPKEDIYSQASLVIGAMVTEGLVELVMTHHRKVMDDLYSPLHERYLTHEEVDLILNHPERWDDEDVFSFINTYQLKITEKGRETLYNIYQGTEPVFS